MTSTITRGRFWLTALLLTLCAAWLTACGYITEPPVADGPARDEEPAALVARAAGEIAVFAAPGDAQPVQALPARTPFGSPTVLLITEEGTGDRAGWLEVRLPVRPNDGTGWIAREDVHVAPAAFEVSVDLDAKRLTVTENGEKVLATTTGTGSAQYPTPTGSFFITDKIETKYPAGPYGPYALGLSAHSDVLTQFMGGEGQIGIHGTNDPSSVGAAASHGCMRIDNGLIERLARLLPLGTPVTIS